MDLVNPDTLQAAADHLIKHDPLLAPVIEQTGLATFEPHTDYYTAIVNSIIGQQVSVASAAAVKRRMQELFNGHYPTPAEVLETDEDTLKSVGLSRQKQKYIRDLAQHIADGTLNFDRITEQSNEELVAMLTDVKGIGDWTAHMFLMFAVGRLDILPIGDLGVRNGVRELYGLTETPTPTQVTEIALENNWHPYESVASWYIWRSLDNNPQL